AERQRVQTIDIPARRGSIVDRNGAKLAFSVEADTLSVNIKTYKAQLAQAIAANPKTKTTYDSEAAAAAKYIAGKVPDLSTEQQLLDLLHKDASFVYLVNDVDPSVAKDIQDHFRWIGIEHRAKREYPGDSLASNIVGLANWRMEDQDVSKHNLHGLVGLEQLRDNDLAGTPGRMLVSTKNGSDNVVIPGTEQDVQAAVPGSDLELTIDSDLQYELQRQLTDYVQQSHAKGGQAVVLDAKTGEVYALADDKTFDPNDRSTMQDPENFNDRAVSTPYEPGSVNKVVTATAAIDYGIATPESTIEVPGQLQVADKTVHDAWTHGTQTFTTTGIFAKSSNIGTLLLAQKVGDERYFQLLKKFGLGQRTGVGLPGESAGLVPPRSQWSATTFGNLPIGQGLSMTVLQMAGMYQAIANDGVRVEPRIVKAKVNPDGTGR